MGCCKRHGVAQANVLEHVQPGLPRCVCAHLRVQLPLDLRQGKEPSLGSCAALALVYYLRCRCPALLGPQGNPGCGDSRRYPNAQSQLTPPMSIPICCHSPSSLNITSRCVVLAVNHRAPCFWDRDVNRSFGGFEACPRGYARVAPALGGGTEPPL
jgi:hypothetical protein